MTGADDLSCRVIGGMLTRWYDGALTGVDLELYEQHLLVCLPCQVQSDKLRAALALLPHAARTPAPDALVEDLVEVARAGGAA